MQNIKLKYRKDVNHADCALIPQSYIDYIEQRAAAMTDEDARTLTVQLDKLRTRLRAEGLLQ